MDKKSKTIQTDNGTEFSYNQAKVKKEHPMDTLLKGLEIKHYKIRPRTPEYNGKVDCTKTRYKKLFVQSRISKV